MGKQSQPRSGPQRLPEGVRDAVARTVQATVGSAQSTRDRAQEAVDEVVRRTESGAGVVRRSVRGAFEDARPATQDDVRQLRELLTEITRRLDAIERSLGTESGPTSKGSGSASSARRGKGQGSSNQQ